MTDTEAKGDKLARPHVDLIYEWDVIIYVDLIMYSSTKIAVYSPKDRLLAEPTPHHVKFHKMPVICQLERYKDPNMEGTEMKRVRVPGVLEDGRLHSVRSV